MAEEGYAGFQAARERAARNLAAGLHHWPSNHDIEQALVAWLAEYGDDEWRDSLRIKREVALDAMRFLKRFEPRLTGPVLRGSAVDASPVHLHLFADPAEQVLFHLMDHHIPCETDERRYPGYKGQGDESYPMYRFAADDVELELTVFPLDGLRQAPPCPVDGRAMRRADIAAVQQLLDDG